MSAAQHEAGGAADASNVLRLPDLAFYRVEQAERRWAVVLVTPEAFEPSRQTMITFPSRSEAIDYARGCAVQTLRALDVGDRKGFNYQLREAAQCQLPQ